MIIFLKMDISRKDLFKKRYNKEFKQLLAIIISSIYFLNKRSDTLFPALNRK